MSTAAALPPEPDPGADRPELLSALVVEDEPAIRELLCILLRELGLEVSSCGDGEEAWRLLEQQKPDMLFADWMLPGTTGPDLVQQIRMSERHPGLYIILVTGRTDRADLIEGLEAGADDFLPKPFDEGEFRVRVRAGQRVAWLQRRLRAQNELLHASNLEMSRELHAAGRLQRALIPAGATNFPGYDWGWAFQPLGEASGDMFGVFPLDERHVGAFLVDVSGHGMAAAMLSFTVSRLLTPVPGHDTLVKRRLKKAPYYEIVQPDLVLKGLRDWFERDETSGFYFTLIYVILNSETGDVRWVSAGHPAPILCRAGSCETQQAQLAQTPIGLPVATRGDVGMNRASLAPGDRIFLLSDGVLELRGPDGQWLGEHVLGEAITQGSGLAIPECLGSVVNQLRQRCGRAGFEDDVTLVGLERRRPVSPA